MKPNPSPLLPLLPSIPGESTEFMRAMSRLSGDLQGILRAAGYAKGSGVSTEGVALVKRVAKARSFRNWPDTRNEADYERLIEAVKKELAT